MQVNANIAGKRPIFDLLWPVGTPLLRTVQATSRSTQLQRAETRREDVAISIVDETLGCVEVVDRLGCLVFVNATGLDMLGRSDAASLVGTPWINNWVFENESEASAALAAVEAGQSAQFEAYRRGNDGTIKPWNIFVSGMTGSRSLVVSRDLTPDRQALSQQRLVNAELQHRIKNTLAIVQSLVSQTLRDGVNVEDARHTLADRLSALACAGDMLIRTDWQALPMATVVMDALSFMKLGVGRIVVDGPDVTVGPKSAFMLTMVLHELSTNAVKYGALSVDGGHVELSWWLVRSGGDVRVHMSWTERDGPPVGAPVRTGFGSRLISQVAERQLRGTVSLAFDPTGIVWSIDAPLRALAA